MFMFGHNKDEVDELWAKGYYAGTYYANNERLRAILESLNVGFGGENFADISAYLLSGPGVADPYLCLADFESYRRTQLAVSECYREKERWNKMSFYNIAASGYFAADRSITEYAERIWGLRRLSEER